MTKRSAFYIDGLNLYHAIDNLNQPHLKWLCLTTLADTIIPSRDEDVTKINYFSQNIWKVREANQKKIYY